MKVGEIIFYYHNQPPLTCLYVTETQRLAMINQYKHGATYYTTIPYEGYGMPNMINTKRKWYASDNTAAARLHSESNEGKAFNRAKAYQEWHKLDQLNQLNIRVP